jgi:hypothetical protein
MLISFIKECDKPRNFERKRTNFMVFEKNLTVHSEKILLTKILTHIANYIEDSR